MANTLHEYLMIKVPPEHLGALDAELEGPDAWHVPLDLEEPLARTLARMDGLTGWDLHRAGFRPLSAHDRLRVGALCSARDVASWKAQRAAEWAPFPPPPGFPLSPGCALDLLTPGRQPRFRLTPLSLPKLLPLHVSFLCGNGAVGNTPSSAAGSAFLEGDGSRVLPGLTPAQGWWYSLRADGEDVDWMGYATGTNGIGPVSSCYQGTDGRAYRWTTANVRTVHLQSALARVLLPFQGEAFGFWHEDGGRAGWWHLDAGEERERSGEIAVPTPKQDILAAHDATVDGPLDPADIAITVEEWDRWHAAWPSRVAAIALRHAAHIAQDRRWDALAASLAPYGNG